MSNFILLISFILVPIYHISEIKSQKIANWQAYDFEMEDEVRHFTNTCSDFRDHRYKKYEKKSKLQKQYCFFTFIGKIYCK